MRPLILDALGQSERVNRLYTQLTLCFPLPDQRDIIVREATEDISRAVTDLSSALPWTSGEVILDQDGLYKIIEQSGQPPRAQLLRIRDLREECTSPSLTWEGLMQTKFPFSMMDEDVIAPCKTMMAVNVPRPVLLLQANIIWGGLLLTICAQHGSMDMAGMARVTSLLAQAMRNAKLDLTNEEIEIANGNRRSRTLKLEDIQLSLHAPEELLRSTSQQLESSTCDDKQGRVYDLASPVEQNLVWVYFAFPQESIAGLKRIAQDVLPAGKFISSDDTLTAFIWQTMARAAEPRLASYKPQTMPSSVALTTNLVRNVDARRFFDSPATYPGFITASTSHTSSADDLLRQRDLGSIAAELRDALQDQGKIVDSLKQQVATVMNMRAHGSNDITNISHEEKNDEQSYNIKLSSWAKEDFYGMDFGPKLGKPRVVRRPRFVHGAREGLVYLLPKDSNGEIVVGICMLEEDMKRLQADHETVKWARWIG